MRDAFRANPIVVLYRRCDRPRAKKDAAGLTITDSKQGYLAVISSDAQSNDGNGMGYTEDKRQR
jgi:1,4-dihydroxy-2-naphthoyl-CoA synthase